MHTKLITYCMHCYWPNPQNCISSTLTERRSHYIQLLQRYQSFQYPSNKIIRLHYRQFQELNSWHITNHSANNNNYDNSIRTTTSASRKKLDNQLRSSHLHNQFHSISTVRSKWSLCCSRILVSFRYLFQ
jgi:hypothetical protein